MSTFKEIIEKVDDFKPNAFSVRTKLNWLTTLNGKLATDVLRLGIEEVRALPHKFPEALECEGVVSYPHEDLYELWLQATIDYANEDYDKYHNTMERYNEALSNFTRYFLNTWRPAQGRQVVGFEPDPGFPVYYITAYGMAVMCGFRGSLDEWFESMKIKGDPGKTAYEYAREGGFQGSEEEFSDLLNQGKTAYMYAKEGGYTGSVADFRAKMAAEYADKVHDHGDTYATKNHDHGETYAAKNHDHGETYAAKNHGHGETYAAKNHDHGETYATKNHDHSDNYIILKENLHFGDTVPEGLPEGALFLVPLE